MSDGAGSLFALGMRVTKLNADGSPMVGSKTCYKTDALVSLEIGLDYTKPDAVEQRNGAGVICVSYAAPASLTGGVISALDLCTPDPDIMAFMVGGNTYLDGGGETIGYQAPAVGVNPVPNGVSIEFWTSAIIDGAVANHDPYFWWVIPRAYMTASGTWKAESANPLLPEFEGTSQQNPNWGAGPDGQWEFDSSRVWQFVRTATIPDLSAGFEVVTPPATVTSIAVTPATPSIAIDADVQMTATATFSDASTRDVTAQAVWTSADITKAIVTDLGLVEGIAAGTSLITAAYGGHVGTTTATVHV